MTEEQAKIDYENLLDEEYTRKATDGEIVHLPSDLRKALNVSEKLEQGLSLKVVINTKDDRVDDDEAVLSFRYEENEEEDE